MELCRNDRAEDDGFVSCELVRCHNSLDKQDVVIVSRARWNIRDLGYAANELSLISHARPEEVGNVDITGEWIQVYMLIAHQ